jgi:tRNA-uridine 2-sulfurtransferase
VHRQRPLVRDAAHLGLGEVTDREQGVGEHRGLMYYTLGQRQGLALGGVRGAAEAPWYVARKDLARNVLVVTQRHGDPALMCLEFETGPCHWIAGGPPAARFACTVRTRHRQPDQACEVIVLQDGGCRVTTGQPQRAVTPGQAAVFYDGAACLGGGTIERVRTAADAAHHASL